MKKSIFILAAAACVALCNISCGSDDDGGSSSGNTPVKLPQPTYSDLAADFAIPVDAVTADGDNGASLTGLNFTESGKAIVEVSVNGAKKYVTYNYNANGGTYVITDKTGKKVGELKTVQAQAPTRSTTDITVTFEVEVYFYSSGTSYSFQTDGTVARKAIQSIASTDNTVNLARTWVVQEMKMTLEGDVSASINVQGGNLRILGEEAKARGANLTKDELEEMNKVVKGMTLDKNGLFSIEYDEVTEACSWQWTDANQDKLRIKLRDSEFGNRFLCENSDVHVKFFVSGVCHFTITTDITTSTQKYKATLLVVMKEA